MDNLKFIEVKSELGAGTRGASMGIEAMKVAAHNAGDKFFASLPAEEIMHENNWLYRDVNTPRAKHIEGILEMYRRIYRKIAAELQAKVMPIVLAGDHSSAGATIAGIRAAYPQKRVGVIWIDAHADLHSPYTSPSGNVHGMPLAAALGEDNVEVSEHEVSEDTIELWESLKHINGISPWIMPEDIVFAGVRDIEREELHLLKKHQIKNFSVEEARGMGMKATAKKMLERLRHCDFIYLSFDVDSLDCDLISRGTGTPVPDGFSEPEMHELIAELAKSDKLCCLEVVEVNPTLDNKCNKMAEAAFRILKHAVETIRTHHNVAVV
jgi:arginase